MTLAEARTRGAGLALRIVDPNRTTVKTCGSDSGCSLTQRLDVKLSMMRLPGSRVSPQVGLARIMQNGWYEGGPGHERAVS